MGCKPSKDMIKKVVNPVDDDTGETEPEEKEKKINRISRQSAQEEEGERQNENGPPGSEDFEEEEKAAVAIQAAFRGHQTRKELRSTKMASDEPTKEQLEAEFRPDDKELCHAATKIQASFRGHQARKKDDVATSSNAKVEELSKDMQKMAQEEELDIDLTDPDLHKAATKIQASFRGHKVRKDDPK